MDKSPEAYKQTLRDVQWELGYVRKIGSFSMIGAPSYVTVPDSVELGERHARLDLGRAFDYLTTDQQQRALELFIADRKAEQTQPNG